MSKHIWHFLLESTDDHSYAKKHTRREITLGVTNNQERKETKGGSYGVPLQ